MSARQRYAGLSQAERRSAAHHVRSKSNRGRLDQTRLDVFAELVMDSLVHDGEVDAYWLYCWELASRVYALRSAASVMDGAR